MERSTPFDITPPADTPEYMYDAYFSCLVWALQFEPIHKEFANDTGINIPKPRTPFEQAIDKACGHNPYEEFVKAFTPWFNTWVWGKMDGTEPNE